MLQYQGVKITSVSYICTNFVLINFKIKITPENNRFQCECWKWGLTLPLTSCFDGAYGAGSIVWEMLL